MKVIDKLNVAGKTILTLDGNVLEIKASKVVADGKKYDFYIAYDMSNTIGIDVENIECDFVEFV